jgi:hypothetical protein
MVIDSFFDSGRKWASNFFGRFFESRVTAGTAKDTLLATYNDLENVQNRN